MVRITPQSTTATIPIPLEVWRFFKDAWTDKEAAKKEAGEALVLDMVRRGRVSARKGAELLGLTHRDFLNLMHKHGLPTVIYEDDWLEHEQESLQVANQQT